MTLARYHTEAPLQNIK